MDVYLKKYGTHSLVNSLILIIFSIFLIFKPMQFLNTLMIIFGIIIAIDGLAHTVSYLQNKNYLQQFNFELLLGVIELIFGFLFITKQEILISFLPILIGAWIIIESVIKIKFAITIKTEGNKQWLLLLLLSIIAIVFGLYVIFNPLSTVSAILTASGIVLLVSEILNSLECIYILMNIK